MSKPALFFSESMYVFQMLEIVIGLNLLILAGDTNCSYFTKTLWGKILTQQSLLSYVVSFS